MRTGGPLLLALALGACAGDERAPWPTESPIGPVAAEPQRDGDAEAGYAALINAGYVGCGVPYSAYSQVFAAPGCTPTELAARRLSVAKMFSGDRT